MSHYFWSVEIPPQGVGSLGSLTLRVGASVVGWVEAPRREFRFEDLEVRLQPLFGSLPANAVDLHRAGSLGVDTAVNHRGFFELTGMLPGSYALVVEHPEYAPSRIAPVPVHDRAETEIHRVVLELPVRLEVQLDPPPPPYHRGWQVELQQMGDVPGHLDVVASGLASQEGLWQADRLSPGRYLLKVGDPSGARWAAQEVMVADGLPPIEVSLPYVRVEGILRLGGEPLAADLYFGGRFGARRVAARSDGEGKFYIVLPQQDEPWIVEIVASAIGLEALVGGVEPRRAPGEPWAKTEIDLPDGRVAGVVVDESGAPVPGVLVEAVAAADRARPASSRSSPDGSFELRALDEGAYYLEAVHHRQGRSLSAEPALVEVVEGSPAERVRIELLEELSLSGQVLSPAGEGVPGARVLALLDRSERPLHGVMPSATTDLDGGFELNLPRGAGRVIVTVLAPGYAIESRVVDARRAEWLPLELDPTGGTLAVSYDDGEATTPAALKFRTMIFNPHMVAPSSALIQWAELHGMRNDADVARLVIPMLKPGPYTVCYDVGFAVWSTGHLPPGGLPDRCASGELPPFGELHLTVPVPPPAPAAPAD